MNTIFGVIRFLVFIILFISCKRSDSIEVSGVLTDGKTGDVVANVDVTVGVNTITKGVYSNNFIDVGSALSDENGRYSISFDIDNAVEYQISASKNGWFGAADTIKRDRWQPGEANEYDLVVYRRSNIDFEFSNGNSSAILLFKLDPMSDGCVVCCNSNSIAIKAYSDTSFNCNVYGNQTLSYEVNRIEGGGTELMKGTIGVFDDQVTFRYPQ
jgi:signal peptidase I